MPGERDLKTLLLNMNLVHIDLQQLDLAVERSTADMQRTRRVSDAPAMAAQRCRDFCAFGRSGIRLGSAAAEPGNVEPPSGWTERR